jgi:hypothetical protein
MKNKRGGNNTQSYKVYKYDIEGNFLREFDSLRDAMFVDNLQKVHLIHHLQGQYEHCKKNIYSKTLYLKYPQELLPQFKNVYQYDLNGNYIREFEHAEEAFKITGINNISDNLRNIKKQAGKFIWSYEKKEKIDPFIKPPPNNTTKIVQYDLKGKFIKVWDTIISASDELKINACYISGICMKRKCHYQSKGFIFRYYKGHKRNLPKSDITLKSHKKPIIQYTLKGKKIKEYSSLTQASKKTGITQWIIGYGSGGGFIWKYKF